MAALRAQLAETLALLSPIEEDFAGTFTYAPGKWTLKQIVGHLADDERIFIDRALRVARGDETPQPGFDEKGYVENAGFERRSFADLLAEYRAVREAAIRLVSTFTREAWLRRGNVNGYAASARGLVFQIAGHELHTCGSCGRGISAERAPRVGERVSRRCRACSLLETMGTY